MREHHAELDEQMIHNFLRYGTAGIDEELEKTMKLTACDYAKKVFRKLREHGYDPRIMKLYVVGGGGNSGAIAAVLTAKMTCKAISTKEVRGTLPKSCSGRQNLPKPRESPLLQREGDPAVRPCSGKTQERRGTEQGPGLPGRMRAGRSRTQIQPGKAEMWNGSGDGEAGRYSCACGCSVHSAAESAKDSVRFFTISGLAARLFATVRKTVGCSVDIT